MVTVEAPVSICCGALYARLKQDTVTRTGHIVGNGQRAFCISYPLVVDEMHAEVKLNLTVGQRKQRTGEMRR